MNKRKEKMIISYVLRILVDEVYLIDKGSASKKNCDRNEWRNKKKGNK